MNKFLQNKDLINHDLDIQMWLRDNESKYDLPSLPLYKCWLSQVNLITHDVSPRHRQSEGWCCCTIVYPIFISLFHTDFLRSFIRWKRKGQRKSEQRAFELREKKWGLDFLDSIPLFEFIRTLRSAMFLSLPTEVRLLSITTQPNSQCRTEEDPPVVHHLEDVLPQPAIEHLLLPFNSKLVK